MSYAHLTDAGFHLVTEAGRELFLPWSEISDVVCSATILPCGRTVQHLSFSTAYGHATEISDSDGGWQQVIEQLPRFLPSVASDTASILTSPHPAFPLVLFSRPP